jgi:hypothetical protein
MLLTPFYVVWNPARNGPAVQHKTFEEAFKEAERLGKINPQETFLVLRPVAVNKPVEKRQWLDYDYREVMGQKI